VRVELVRKDGRVDFVPISGSEFEIPAELVFGLRAPGLVSGLQSSVFGPEAAWGRLTAAGLHRHGSSRAFRKK
jgi:hypothetical protein